MALADRAPPPPATGPPRSGTPSSSADLADQRLGPGSHPARPCRPGTPTARPRRGRVRRAASTRPSRRIAAPTTTWRSTHGLAWCRVSATPGVSRASPDPHRGEHRRDRRRWPGPRRPGRAAGTARATSTGARAPDLVPGRAVHRALTWDPEDRRDRAGGRRASPPRPTRRTPRTSRAAGCWWSRGTPRTCPASREPEGSRLTFLDLRPAATGTCCSSCPWSGTGRCPRAAAGPCRRHRLARPLPARRRHRPRGHHLPARRPDAGPRRALGDASRLGVEADRVSSYGYRYVLPVRFAYRAMTDEGHERLRYSFLSLDRARRRRSWSPASTARGADPAAGPLPARPGDPVLAQARTASPGRWSRRGRRRPHAGRGGRRRPLLRDLDGPWVPGSVYVGQPGTLRRLPWATPMGPEDIS